MIISKDVIWLHLPKTGGTTLNCIFRDLKNFYVDSDSEMDRYGIRIKHDSIGRRERMSSWRYSGQKKFITCRRLPDWLLSDFFFKRNVLNISSDFNLCKSGMVKYQLRHSGEIKSADWWLEYFKIDDTTSLRITNLEEDINNKLVPFTEDLDYVKIDLKINYTLNKKNVLDYFSIEDIERIYNNNPLWKNWEKTTYRNTYLEIV